MSSSTVANATDGVAHRNGNHNDSPIESNDDNNDTKTRQASIGSIACSFGATSENDATDHETPTSHDPDLRIWLDYTGYFDVSYRVSLLDKLKKLKEIDDQRSRLIVDLRDTASGVALSLEPRPINASLTGVHQVGPINSTYLTKPFQLFNQITCQVEEIVSPSGGLADSKLPGMPKGQAIAGHNTIVAPPKTRYFLLKSSTMVNLFQSQRDGVWITQAKNGQMLADAFHNSTSVILFFSVNKSKAFQGYARMTTAPSSDVIRPDWMTKINLRTSEAFGVDWIKTADMDFWRFGDLTNTLNDGAPIFVGRDGQEYSTTSGQAMVDIFEQHTRPQDGSKKSGRHDWRKGLVSGGPASHGSNKSQDHQGDGRGNCGKPESQNGIFKNEVSLDTSGEEVMSLIDYRVDEEA